MRTTEPAPTTERTASHNWASKIEEVNLSRWMKVDDQGPSIGTSIQPPWKYFANLDLWDGDLMCRLANYFNLRLAKPDNPKNVDYFNLLKFDKNEYREAERMFEESLENQLLTDMLRWFAWFHDAHERKVSSVAEELANLVTVR
jgi:hypothetical protein